MQEGAGIPPSCSTAPALVSLYRKTLANPLPLPTIISIEVKDQTPEPKHVERLVFSASEKKVCLTLQAACFPVWACCTIRVYMAAFIRASQHTLQTSHSQPSKAAMNEPLLYFTEQNSEEVEKFRDLCRIT